MLYRDRLTDWQTDTTWHELHL